jgi:hypothetical protein
LKLADGSVRTGVPEAELALSVGEGTEVEATLSWWRNGVIKCGGGDTRVLRMTVTP